MKGYGHPSAITIGAILLGVAILSISPSPGQAQATKGEHKLTLRAIMQELGAEYLRLAVAGGRSEDDPDKNPELVDCWALWDKCALAPCIGPWQDRAAAGVSAQL